MPSVPSELSSTLSLATDSGEEQSLSQWLTTFNLLAVVIDPYTHQSGWILPTADRLFNHYSEADIRKILGENLLRVWSEVEDYAATTD